CEAGVRPPGDPQSRCYTPLARVGAPLRSEGRCGRGPDPRRHRRALARDRTDRRLGHTEAGAGAILEPLAPSPELMEIFRAPRVCSDELVRHRAGFGYAQLSQRYVDECHAAFVLPPAIIGDATLEREWEREVADAQAAYVRAVDGLMQRFEWVADKVHRRKLAREAARSVLPNATEVKIVVSGNARAWRTMLELRCGEGAELEIRRMAIACLRALQREASALFSDFEIYVADDTQEAARVAYHKV